MQGIRDQPFVVELLRVTLKVFEVAKGPSKDFVNSLALENIFLVFVCQGGVLEIEVLFHYLQKKKKNNLSPV